MAKPTPFKLQIASPCRASWNNMDGDTQVRFCRECNRNVYDLSTMTQREAQRLVNDREGRLCVRFYQRADGTVLTSDCPVGQKRSFLRSTAHAAAAVTLAASGLTKLVGCGDAQGDGVEGEAFLGSPGAEQVQDVGDSVQPIEPFMGEPEPLIMGEIEAHIPDDLEDEPPIRLMGRIALPPQK